MLRTITAVFDCEVLRPEGPVDLQPGARYALTLAELPETHAQAEPGPKPLLKYLHLCQDLGVADLAEQHDHYLYGTPKR